MTRKRQHHIANDDPPEESEEHRFLEHLWEPLPQGLIEIRALPNGKGSGSRPRQEWFETVGEALEFAAEFDNRHNGYGVYFGVGKRSRRGGGKQDVLGATALWADIDTTNLGWDAEKCLRKLHNAPSILRPSALIHSGGGLHAYWFLKSALQVPGNTKLIETANAAMARLVHGDNVGNVDRIMRLPGSWNSKRGIASASLCAVRWCYYWERSDAEELMRKAERHGPIFVGSEFAQKPQLPQGVRSSRTTLELEHNTSIDDLWTKRVRYHATGGKCVGVNVAIMRTTARLHCHGWSDDKIIDEVLRRVRRIQRTQAPSETWDWELERETIRKSLERWKPKWKALHTGS